MSPTHPQADHLPRSLLMTAGALVLVALVAVTAVRLSGAEIRSPDASPVLTRSLRFADTADGSVAIIDARSGQEVDRVQGEAGFLRGALRAMARERRMRGLGGEAPFDLIGRADGRTTLFDPATGQRIDLDSFGPTNAGNFVRLLTAAAPDSAVQAQAQKGTTP